MIQNEKISCHLAGRCSGCSWIDKSYLNQVKEKKENLVQMFKEYNINYSKSVELITISPGRLRDRVDLTIKEQSGIKSVGLFDMEKKTIIDMNYCPMMSESLQNWFLDFKKILPPIELGSVRLRISPDGERGAWLDFSNKDIQRLLREKDWIKDLQQVCTVEVGQKKKAVVEKKNGSLVLESGNLFSWFETYIEKDLKPFPLFSAIGSFTQPGFRSNFKIIQEVTNIVRKIEPCNVLELCSGIGNFTFPLLSLGFNVYSYEMDPVSIASINKSMEGGSFQGRLENIQDNIHKSNSKAAKRIEDCELILVDPPRSGLQDFTSALNFVQKKPKHFLYISCFLKSLAIDLQELQKMGYNVKSVSGIDQFPQSPHCEYIVYLTKEFK